MSRVVKATKDEVIAHQAQQLLALKRKVKEQKERLQTLDNITARQKREAGAADYESWDTVWPRILGKAKRWDESQPTSDLEADA